MSTDQKVVENINQLYKENQNHTIVRRTINTFETLLKYGWSSKRLIVKALDMGIKPLERGIAIAVALSRTDPKHLSEIDKKLRMKTIKVASDMIKQYEELELDDE